MSPSKVWLISGANTGFGLELSLKYVSAISLQFQNVTNSTDFCRALKEGDKVVAAVRNPSKIPDALKRDDVATLAFDLAWSQEKINNFAKDAFAAFGTLDVVVNNAAYAYMGAIEESDDEQLKSMSIPTTKYPSL